MEKDRLKSMQPDEKFNERKLKAQIENVLYGRNSRKVRREKINKKRRRIKSFT
jgi:hypothetical protein